MFWFLYNLLFLFGFLLLLPRFIYRMCRRGGYRHNFMQRAACYDHTVRSKLAPGDRIWVQAVSVGEVFVALRFMEELRARQPDVRFVLSTNTSTGHAIAKERINSVDQLIYFPVDFPAVMSSVLNLIRILVNGRISEHSYAGYRKLRVFTRRILEQVDLLCVQSDGDAERLRALGAPAERVHVMGSAKYEVVCSDSQREAHAASLLELAGIGDEQPVLLGGSTWPGEERVLLDIYIALREEHPGLMLVLAPRHVERTPEVLKEIDQCGLSVVQRSTLLDSTGELTSFYPHADIIFIGKSLTQHGGQNIIEPAMFGKPIVVGPNMENFPVVIDDFLEAGAIVQVADATELQIAPSWCSRCHSREDYGVNFSCYL